MTTKEEVLAACDLLGLELVYSFNDVHGFWPLRFLSTKTKDYVLEADVDALELRCALTQRKCYAIDDYIFKKALHILQTAKLTIDGKTIGPLNWSSLEELKLKLVVNGDII